MDWLSRCVCGSKQSRNNFSKRKRKKTKLKSKKVKKNGGKYMVSDKKNIETISELDSTLRIQEHRDDDGIDEHYQVIQGLEESSAKNEQEIIEADDPVNLINNNEVSQIKNNDDIVCMTVKSTDIHDPEFYDSLLDNNSIHNNQECNFNFVTVDEKQKYTEETNYNLWNDVKHNHENIDSNLNHSEDIEFIKENNYCFNSNSCSFIVPIIDNDNKNRDKRRAYNNKKINSMIPKPSPRCRNDINTKKSQNGIYLFFKIKS